MDGNNIFDPELEKKFEQYDIVKRKLGQTNFDVNKAKELFADAPEEINIDVYGLRKQFSVVCIFGLGYVYSLYRFSKSKASIYFKTGYPMKLITRGLPFMLLNLAFFNKSLEYIFEKLLRNKFVEKVLEREKGTPGYEDHRKLFLNQLNYYIKRKNAF
jgi:hypothetical protein